MLAVEPFCQETFVKAGGDQILVRRAPAGQNCAARINQRQDKRRLHPLIFRLDVIYDAVVFNLCVVAGYHCDSKSASVIRKKLSEKGQLES